VETNCAAIPDNLIESELFGHERGAFTDAVSRRRGKFELAHGGTLFMDEVADMSLSAQAKVLRVLQEMSFERVGGEEPLRVDVRVIAATNKDIKEEIAAGRFREDLFFRLNVIPVQMPALRERKDDIPLLAAYFLERYSDERGLPGRRFNAAAIDALMAHDWPGNVRELKNLVERISVMSDEEEIGPDTVAAHMDKRALAECGEGLPGDFAALKLGEARDLFERNYLLQKLKENGYNISRTAESIGVYPSNLHAKIRKYGIRLDK
jgi:two-component system nitrogen regulation response regulator NtrX